MIDLKDLRDDPEEYRKSERRRGRDPRVVDCVLAADDRVRDLRRRVEGHRADRNQRSKNVGVLMGAAAKAEKAGAANAEQARADAEQARREAATFAAVLGDLEDALRMREAELAQNIALVGAPCSLTCDR